MIVKSLNIIYDVDLQGTPTKVWTNHLPLKSWRLEGRSWLPEEGSELFLVPFIRPHQLQAPLATPVAQYTISKTNSK